MRVVEACVNGPLAVTRAAQCDRQTPVWEALVLQSVTPSSVSLHLHAQALLHVGSFLHMFCTIYKAGVPPLGKLCAIQNLAEHSSTS